MNKLSLQFTFLLIATWLQGYTNFQQPANYRFQYLLIEDGLPQNTINAIARDQAGFMWFGTNNGICRYDGYAFNLFKSEENQSNSLPDNMISCVEPGLNNRLWIGSLNGLSYYDPQSGRIHKWNACNENESINRVTALVANKTDLWVGTSNNGLIMLSLNEQNEYCIKHHFSQENGMLPSNNVTALYMTAQKQLYVGTQNGALVYHADENRFSSIAGARQLPQNTLINDVFESSKGDLYFSTYNGLCVFWANNVQAEWYLSIPNAPNSLQHNTINIVREDANGQILVGTLGGLHLFETYSGNFYAFPEAGPDHFKLNNIFINTLFCDENGNVWIGTEKGGINKFNVYQNQFEFYANDPNDPNSLNENTINSILKEKDALWVGTAGGGLNHLNYKTGKFRHFTFSNFNTSSISSDYITSVLRGGDGSLWVGSWGGGLNRIRTAGTEVNIQRITNTTPGIQNELVNYFVSSLVNDPRGFLMIGTEGGLSTFDFSSNKFTTLLAEPTIPVPLSEIGCMLLDSKDFYWIGTRNGLYRFPSGSVRATRDAQFSLSNLQFFQSDTTAGSLPGNYVISLMEDRNGAIWIGTYGNGIARCHIENNELTCTTFTQEQGLSNNVVYGIQEDQNGNIWMSTDNGLSMFDVKTSQFKNFIKQDGLLNNQFYWSASHKSYDGELYFGGTEGLNFFKPENIYNYRYVPTPRITRMTIYNQEVKPGEKFHDKVVIHEPIYLADTIELTYRDNNLSFDFSAFDYYLPEKASFSYMLTDIDKDWITVPAQRRFANYSNLSGGTYTLLLRASNGDGIWNENPTKVTIIITPPFWQTQWFKIILVIFVLLVTFSLIQLQMRRIISQKKALEEKVRNRTQKIEDQKVMLEKQAAELMNYNTALEKRQSLIEQQKQELENKNDEILKQRDELILLNNKVKDINLHQMQFFMNISHEFRTPLTLIISPLERLIGKFSSNNDETSSLLRIINRNAQRLLMLINQLLEIRKIETGNQELLVELTETKPFLLEIFHAFDELASKNEIQYTCEFEVNNVAWIDKEKLENVIYNLLSNAFKFTPKQQKIHFSVHSERLENADYLSLSVSDTGIGIPKNQQGRLFDRFFQVSETKKHPHSGTGIGLSLVKSLVEMMYGKIGVESEPGKGSIFTVNIPVSKQYFAEHEIDKSGQVFESNIKNKVALLVDRFSELPLPEIKQHDSSLEKILVVEDNPEMRAFIGSTLSHYYQVFEAPDGVEGYQMAKDENFSLIISDVMMPEMNGLELCRKIKNNLYTSHIPIILLTAKGNVEDFVEGLEQGADDYIAKPFNTEILLAKVHALIENRKVLRNKFSALEDVSPSEITTSNLDQQFFQRVNDIVEKYYTDSAFDVDHFASEMYVSRSQLYKKMKAITNLSANDFINVYRLKKSKELLQNSNLQIGEIAYATGFNDPKYFSRIFKKYYKCSPSDFVRK
jgi:signal transduction histidine kinase/ligand-binding sensor domain-containing protein/DNA-binding response OmpR family regulator